MSELALAYQHTQLTFDYNPDAEQIAALRAQGLYVVVTDSLAYCPITDATLPTPSRRLATLWGKPMAYACRDQAIGHRDLINRCYDDGESTALVIAPDGTTITATLAEDAVEMPSPF